MLMSCLFNSDWRGDPILLRTLDDDNGIYQWLFGLSYLRAR